jgi:ribosomal protein S18 acetylase RimI-like enzyme
MLIRKARSSDLRSLERMARDLDRYQASIAPELKIRVPTSRQKTLALAGPLKKRNVQVVVAEVDGALVGYVLGTVDKPIHFKLRRLGNIHACYVEAGHRRGGVGKALVDAVVEWFRSEGVQAVDLGVLHSNEAFRFWRKLGFREYYLKMRMPL